jgi:TPP-dependent pyruvate/acetoin dehydrogenase alpha subunit
MKYAAEKARGGGGPTLIEALTYRLGAHSTSDDPSRYRDESEAERWKKEKDPLVRLEKHLLHTGHLADHQIPALHAEADRHVRAAIAAVENLPLPPRETLCGDVFARPSPRLKKQLDEMMTRPPAPTEH